jgi:hypothetical protein
MRPFISCTVIYLPTLLGLPYLFYTLVKKINPALSISHNKWCLHNQMSGRQFKNICMLSHLKNKDAEKVKFPSFIPLNFACKSLPSNEVRLLEKSP